ncbi:hypothetical protein H5410_064472, partial [Solanum commersonii]
GLLCPKAQSWNVVPYESMKNENRCCLCPIIQPGIVVPFEGYCALKCNGDCCTLGRRENKIGAIELLFPKAQPGMLYLVKVGKIKIGVFCAIKCNRELLYPVKT